jgi:hypothetical protein
VSAPTGISKTDFTANWSYASGATGCLLDVSTSSSFVSYVGAYRSLDVGNTLAFDVSGLNSGTIYYYRVRVYNGAGTSANSGIAAAATLSASGGGANSSHSPVGTWEITVSGKDQGIAFITFGGDYTLSGYGMTLKSFGLFTLAGTWSIDAKGNTVGFYTESTPDGSSFDGTFTGKATKGRTLAGKTVSQNGSFTLSGVPAKTTPDVSGDWGARVTQGKTISTESLSLSSSADFPGVFDFAGDGSGSNGSFSSSGQMIVSSKGKAVVSAEADDAQGNELSLSSLTGTFNLRSQTVSFSGKTSSGASLRVKMTR